MRSVRYLISGEPMASRSLYVSRKRLLSEKDIKIIVRRAQLNSQADSNDIISEPFRLHITAYFMTPCRDLKLDGLPCESLEDPLLLIQFVKSIGEDIIFTKGTPCLSIECFKVYDYDPRTEIKLYF